ncbi:putative DFG5 protein [Apiospora arundinis]|uniref:Mannan endo-1,6-alpha-mannosidase n=1 Tax=Apiospora arundinis TaxID=335852 RepID=A0ABR2JMW8_9PEZI
MRLSKRIATGLLSLPCALAALSAPDFTSKDSLAQTAKVVAKDLISFYKGEDKDWIYAIGILPGPPPEGDYYWWIGGAMWGTLLDYRHATGDNTYDKMITRSMIEQSGENKDFMPANWTASMGNDDQGFWAMSAMLAVETNFPAPPPETKLDWLALVQAVWNEQTMVERRVETKGSRCEGGLRWQAHSVNNGWDYINTISNGIYFNLGARLARYTGNKTYAEHSEKTFEMLERLAYIDKEGNVHDGAHLPKNCLDVNKLQFSYNAAVLIQGAAYMYDVTGQSQKWKDRLDLLVDRSLAVFLPKGVAFEYACEGVGSCNVDMRSFKGYLHRWVSQATVLAPHIKDKVMKAFETSARAGVAACQGGGNGQMCGFAWEQGGFDKPSAVHQMNVLGALTGLMMKDAKPPVTNATGGTSKGDANAGNKLQELRPVAPITAADRVGAGILTSLVLAGFVGSCVWMSLN